MPAEDPVDQEAARALKTSLRHAVDRLELPPIELEWFMSLPKRTRRSARLIETVKIECWVLLEHARAAWTKTRQTEQEQEAQAQPRDLECLRAPDPAAWNGLGRRKKRCRAFESVWRAFNTRHRLSSAAPDVSSSTKDVFLLHPSSCYVPKRASTPLGLCESIRNIPGLIYTANGPANPADYGFPSPCSPTPPVSPPSPAPLPPPPDFPRAPRPGEFRVRGCEIDPNVAYVVAHGRHSHSPQAGYSAQRAAINVYSVEQDFPGALEYLARLLFPGGMGRYQEMAQSAGMEPLVDFVHGWYDLSKRARECA